MLRQKSLTSPSRWTTTVAAASRLLNSLGAQLSSERTTRVASVEPSRRPSTTAARLPWPGPTGDRPASAILARPYCSRSPPCSPSRACCSSCASCWPTAASARHRACWCWVYGVAWAEQGLKHLPVGSHSGPSATILACAYPSPSCWPALSVCLSARTSIGFCRTKRSLRRPRSQRRTSLLRPRHRWPLSVGQAPTTCPPGRRLLVHQMHRSSWFLASPMQPTT